MKELLIPINLDTISFGQNGQLKYHFISMVSSRREVINVNARANDFITVIKKRKMIFLYPLITYKISSSRPFLSMYFTIKSYTSGECNVNTSLKLTFNLDLSLILLLVIKLVLCFLVRERTPTWKLLRTMTTLRWWMSLL